MKSALGSIVAVAVVLLAPVARADDAKATEAEMKFKAGLEHFKAQDYRAACPEFAESERLDPNPSTEYYLAKCALQNQQLALAWNLFKKAAAGLDGPRLAAAEQGATDLNDQVGLVTLVGTQPAPDLMVHLDDEIVTSQVLIGIPIAVEPGAHVLRATAPNRDEWKREFTIAKGESLNFTVPSLPSEAPEVVRDEVDVATKPAILDADVGDDDAPAPIRSGRSHRLGGVLRVAIDGNSLGRGAALIPSVSFRVADRVELSLGAIIGGIGGGHAGATVFLTQGRLRPLVAVGVPVFFIDGAHAGVHGGAGCAWDVTTRLGAFIELGVERYFGLPEMYERTQFVPSIGVQARL